MITDQVLRELTNLLNTHLRGKIDPDVLAATIDSITLDVRPLIEDAVTDPDVLQHRTYS